MWKRAVCHWDATIPGAHRRGQHRRIALTVLEELHKSHTAADDLVLEQIYAQLVVAHGIYKTTRRNRFSALDAMLIDDLQSRFADCETLRVHDVAASSGISSLEFFNALRARRNVAMHLSDLYDRLFIVRAPASGWEVVFDSAGRALQYVGHGFALCARSGESRRYPVNRLLKGYLDRRVFPRATELLAEHLDSDRQHAEKSVREVVLLHPECAQALEKSPNLVFQRHDLFEPLRERYHVVRAMNILNPGYFNEDQLAAGIRACAQGLGEGGLFVVGRSIDEEDGSTQVSAFVRVGNQLRSAWDLNGGAEIKSLVEPIPLEKLVSENVACGDS